MSNLDGKAVIRIVQAGLNKEVGDFAIWRAIYKMSRQRFLYLLEEQLSTDEKKIVRTKKVIDELITLGDILISISKLFRLEEVPVFGQMLREMIEIYELARDFYHL